MRMYLKMKIQHSIRRHIKFKNGSLFIKTYKDCSKIYNKVRDDNKWLRFGSGVSDSERGYNSRQCWFKIGLVYQD